MGMLQNMPAIKEVIESERAPDGVEPLTKDSSDEDMDARIARVGNTFCHAAGSIAMGNVVDTDFEGYWCEGSSHSGRKRVPSANHDSLPGHRLCAGRKAADIIPTELSNAKEKS
ncbi:uncharacterized protein CC84DRAFT_1225948 [Paraphaeosphaeria sporulosa]|uniref:Uncharacterized protein n=1 Tax=Paraphaeosphaeria sporulosa TaxID=1460663 RepID=A0A177CYU5_9PLEO|nr:uncharacterized protein CC84DRAFT_1225948 [Paraphaeosphaeria sporulosa]OAG12052.1 hypothetical protein CC84DRAFT_1225948 [Paraphaeosphaeria sporulosa]